MALAGALGLAVIQAVAGCNGPAREGQMIPEIPESTLSWPHTVDVDISESREQCVYLYTTRFRYSIQESLERAGFFGSVLRYGDAEYRVGAQVNQLDLPSTKTTASVILSVTWKVVERKSGNAVFERQILTDCTVNQNEASFSTDRENMAIEGAVRENILRFILALRQSAHDRSTPWANDIAGH